MKLGYIRVSTEDQNVDRQIDGLRDQCDELVIEKGVSARAKVRPVYEAAIARLQPGDTFVVWQLDRAFRSTVDAIVEADKLRERGISFKIVTLDIDTGTPSGKMIYTLMAALAEWERSNLIERTRQGIAAAKARGVHTGRPRALTAAQIAHAKQEIDAEKGTVASMANFFQVSRMTMYRALKTSETIDCQ